MEIAPIEKLFKSYTAICDAARKNLGRDLTTVEKNPFYPYGSQHRLF